MGNFDFAKFAKDVNSIHIHNQNDYEKSMESKSMESKSMESKMIDSKLRSESNCITVPIYLVTISNHKKLAMFNNSFDNKYLVKYENITTLVLVDMKCYNVNTNMLGRFYNIKKIDYDNNLIELYIC